MKEKKAKGEIDAKKIIASALFRLMDKDTYDNITVSQICREAGYARMSFYRNFNSKDDILNAAFNNSFNKFIENNQQKDGISLFFEFFTENKGLIKKIYDAGKQTFIIEQILKQAGMTENLQMAEQYSVSFFAYTFFSFLDTWYKRGMIDTPQEIRELSKGF